MATDKSSATMATNYPDIAEGDIVENHLGETATVLQIRDRVLYLDVPISLNEHRELALTKKAK